MQGTQTGTKRNVRLECAALGISLVLWMSLGAAQETAQPTSGAEATEPETTRSVAALDGPAEYPVGPGDVLTISVWKEPDVSGDVVVRPDGKISLPLINDLHVGDMSPIAIMHQIAKRLRPYINNPLVTVTVKEINSKVVYVIGEVRRPGQYPFFRPTTVLQILTQAGGLSEFAKKKSIYILRQSDDGLQEKLPFNYEDVVNGRNTQQNISMNAGDTVVVP